MDTTGTILGRRFMGSWCLGCQLRKTWTSWCLVTGTNFSLSVRQTAHVQMDGHIPFLLQNSGISNHSSFLSSFESKNTYNNIQWWFQVALLIDSWDYSILKAKFKNKVTVPEPIAWQECQSRSRWFRAIRMSCSGSVSSPEEGGWVLNESYQWRPSHLISQSSQWRMSTA